MYSYEEKEVKGLKKLPGRESNPGLPRDRRRYLPLYYRGIRWITHSLCYRVIEWSLVGSISSDLTTHWRWRAGSSGEEVEERGENTALSMPGTNSSVYKQKSESTESAKLQKMYGKNLICICTFSGSSLCYGEKFLVLFE